MEVIKYPDKIKWEQILRRPVFETKQLDEKVLAILQDIKSNGDKAVARYTLQFDKTVLNTQKVTEDEIIKSESSVDKSLKKSIDLAVKNIEKFHKAQIIPVKKIETTTGVTCWQKSVAIEKVGLYIPGGTAPLFSTVLMLGIPAKIAGCKEIVLCSPPDKSGNLHPAIVYSAKKIGCTSLYKIGGVQAIGAMAYGTETVPKVYKIFGPGNQFVTAAKQLVSREDVAIDMPAGPSEVAVMANASSNPGFIASDLLSQAEHGTDSHVILVTTDEKNIQTVLDEVKKQLSVLPKKEIAAQSLAKSKIILVNNQDEMVEMINLYAPEHLIISTSNYVKLASRITNAGSVFMGELTPESAGDYASGTNHTLPTNGYAKMYNGVNLDNYVKKITFQEISPEGLKNIGPTIETMASAEKLEAHKNAVSLRLKAIKND
jgi:histidinol dehydrogenase